MVSARQPLRIVPEQRFGAMLRAQRLRDELTQADLAERFGGARQQTIGAWERGTRPQRRYFAELTGYLGLRDIGELESILDDDPGTPDDFLRHPRASGLASVHSSSPAVDELRRAALAALVHGFARQVEDGVRLTPTELSVLASAVQNLA